MRDKLIEILLEREAVKDANAYDRAESLADFLLEKGVIVPPCKVGDVLWYIEDYTKEIKSSVVERLTFEETDISSYTGIWGEYGTFAVPFEDFGKLVFLTREEAEQAMKGGAEE